MIGPEFHTPVPASLEHVPSVEKDDSLTYKDYITQKLEGSRMWDYLEYNDQGDLYINGVKAKEIIEFVAREDYAGTPLEILDTTILQRRCKEWEEMTQNVAEEVGYTGGFDYFYASKANRASEVVSAAIRAGWNIETSSKQDVEDLEILATNGLFDKEKTSIICNGFKLPPNNKWNEIREEASPPASNVLFERVEHRLDIPDSTYAENIMRLHNRGFNITPILDSGEVDYFLDEADQMNVGIRLKFGKVSTDQELDQLTSRFGMTWDEAVKTADKIANSSNLRLTMFHTMVGAAETIKEEEFAQHLSLATDKFFDLAELYPDLTHFNIGGGIPPLSEKYDHKTFLRSFLTDVKAKAEERGLAQPIITFELGSYVVSESGFYIFDVIQQKQNSEDENGKACNWMLVDGSLMEAIPDMLLTGRQFEILAVDNANAPAIDVILGDLTCDSDGRYPPKTSNIPRIKMPDVGENNFAIITGVANYQEQLAGVRGGHHCGLLEAAEAIIEELPIGVKRVRVMERQTAVDSQAIFGYTPAHLSKIKETIPQVS